MKPLSRHYGGNRSGRLPAILHTLMEKLAQLRQAKRSAQAEANRHLAHGRIAKAIEAQKEVNTLTAVIAREELDVFNACVAAELRYWQSRHTETAVTATTADPDDGKI